MRIPIAMMVALLGAGAARADPAAPADRTKTQETPTQKKPIRETPTREKQTLAGFATENPSCREWSDGCIVCARRADAPVACSLPGIACQPAAITCNDHAGPAPPAK